MSNETSTGPEVVYRKEQPYAGVAATVSMASLAEVAHRIPEVLAWLAARSLEPAGPPFFRYNVIDTEADLEVEVGVPVAVPVADEGDVRSRVLPAGRYATVMHVGPPSTLLEATKDLLEWASERGMTWDMVAERSRERWGCRIESYVTNPSSEPDTHKWKTELAFRLAQ
jgi:effector-binding domain-containing protein